MFISVKHLERKHSINLDHVGDPHIPMSTLTCWGTSCSFAVCIADFPVNVELGSVSFPKIRMANCWVKRENWDLLSLSNILLGTVTSESASAVWAQQETGRIVTASNNESCKIHLGTMILYVLKCSYTQRVTIKINSYSYKFLIIKRTFLTISSRKTKLTWTWAWNWAGRWASCHGLKDALKRGNNPRKFYQKNNMQFQVCFDTLT